MCRGRREEEKEKRGSRSSVCCELCDSEATLYCQADDAFLCKKCDERVHCANFLAQRHIRCLLCSTCGSLTRRYLVGVSVEVVLPTIESHCDPATEDDETHCATPKMPFLFL